jgi:hypothetical protein
VSLKKSSLGKICLRNSKIFFDGVFFSIYSYLFQKLKLSKLYRKNLRVLKISKKKTSLTFLKFNFLIFETHIRKIFNYEGIFFLVCFGKTNSFGALSLKKNCGQIGDFLTAIAFFNLHT